VQKKWGLGGVKKGKKGITVGYKVISEGGSPIGRGFF